MPRTIEDCYVLVKYRIAFRIGRPSILLLCVKGSLTRLVGEGADSREPPSSRLVAPLGDRAGAGLLLLAALTRHGVEIDVDGDEPVLISLPIWGERVANPFSHQVDGPRVAAGSSPPGTILGFLRFS